MRAFYSLALALFVLLMLAGGVAVALSLPGWVCVVYGCVGAAGSTCALDLIGMLIAPKFTR